MNPADLSHIAFIPDGNRRAAISRNCSLETIYQEGAAKGLEVVQWCKEIGIAHWTGFGFSNQNTASRTSEELSAISAGVVTFCKGVLSMPGVSLQLFGNVSGIKKNSPEEEVLFAVASGKKVGPMTVYVGFNYDGTVAGELAELFKTIKQRGALVVRDNPRQYLRSGRVPDINLLIRTGGRQRLSGFLPFQTSNAELYFRPILWPDFNREMFTEAIEWFGQQKQTNGG